MTEMLIHSRTQPPTSKSHGGRLGATVLPRPAASRRPALGWVVLCALISAIFGIHSVRDARAAELESPIDLELYAGLLEEHTESVKDLVGTRVDYGALKRSQSWRRLVSQVQSALPSKLDRASKLAFWINTYNILTIDLVLDHYPVESIRDIGSFFSPVWKKTIATIEGNEISLDEIEHGILRKMGEPRIHAAIVCASTSCPSLARKPFRPDELDADLDAAMRSWLASPEKGISIDRSTKSVTVSKIFDWFGEDFDSLGGVPAALAPYVSAEDGEWLRKQGQTARLRYFDYDWSLNDRR